MQNPPRRPYHLSTDRLHISMYQGRERKWFYPFWPNTWLEKEENLGSPCSGYQACHHMDQFSEKEEETRFCIPPCQRNVAPVPTGTAHCHFYFIFFTSADKRKPKRLSSQSSWDLLALKIQHLQPVFSTLLDMVINKQNIIKQTDLQSWFIQMFNLIIVQKNNKCML